MSEDLLTPQEIETGIPDGGLREKIQRLQNRHLVALQFETKWHKAQAALGKSYLC